MARIPYITRELLPAEAQQLWDELLSGGRTRLPLVTQVLMHRPPMAAMVEHLNTMVRFGLSLPRSSVELVILTAARETNCRREWAVHLRQARNAGVREQAIQAIKDHLAPDGLTQEEAELVAYAQELIRLQRVSPHTYEAAYRRLGDVGIVDLTTLVGVYLMLASIMNAFEVEPPEEEDLQLPI